MPRKVDPKIMAEKRVKAAVISLRLLSRTVSKSKLSEENVAKVIDFMTNEMNRAIEEMQGKGEPEVEFDLSQ